MTLNTRPTILTDAECQKGELKAAIQRLSQQEAGESQDTGEQEVLWCMS